MENYSDIEKTLKEYGINKHERTKIINQIKREWKEFKEIYIKSYELAKKDLAMMYDSFIDQFYKYKTKSYVRHGTTGTKLGYGVNLYRANNTFLFKTPGQLPTVGYDINADDMEGDYRYQGKTKEEVLQQVISGYRYRYDDDKVHYEIPWVGSYVSKISNFEIYGATIEEAFNEYSKNFDDILESIFLKLC